MTDYSITAISSMSYSTPTPYSTFHSAGTHLGFAIQLHRSHAFIIRHYNALNNIIDQLEEHSQWPSLHHHNNSLPKHFIIYIICEGKTLPYQTVVQKPLWPGTILNAPL